MYATFLIVAVSATLLWHSGSADVFSALTDMEDLFDTETTVIATVEAFIAAHDKRLDELRNRVRIFKHEHERATADITAYMSNPMNAFMLIKRLTSDWQSIGDLMLSDPIEGKRAGTRCSFKILMVLNFMI